jgi:hypothetical protein
MDDVSSVNKVICYRMVAGTVFTTTSKLVLGPTKPPTEWILAALFSGAEQLEHEDNYSLLCNGQINNALSFTSISPYVLKALYLEHRTNFTFTSFIQVIFIQC